MAETYAVEDCLELSIFFLKSEGFLTGKKAGSFTWYRYGRDDGKMNIGVDVERKFALLSYSVIYGEKRNLDYKVQLTESMPHFGGFRYWFNCPLSGCQSGKVAKLYLPPFQSYFGCRKCYGLQYQSSRKSGSFWGKFDKLIDRLEAGDDSAGYEAMEIMDRIGGR